MLQNKIVYVMSWKIIKKPCKQEAAQKFPSCVTEEFLMFSFHSRVEDDLEKLLKLTSKPKPKVPPKPLLPQKTALFPGNTNSSPLAKPKEDKIQTMNEVDILQYIQENESINDQDTSLF